MIRNQEKIKSELNERQKELLEKYDECNNEYVSLTNEQAFSDGFCLGMKIAVEALIGAENII